MIPTPLLITLLAVATGILGCDQAPTTTAPLTDKAPLRGSTATPEMKDYTFAQRAEFAADMERQRADIARELDVLETKIEKANDSVKAEAKPRLQALREQSAQLSTQIASVKDATESTWDSVKAGSKKAYEQMVEGFTQARQWVSEKIAP